MGWGSRMSVNNFSYNHIGHFANASHAFAKALVMGGVTKRFPTLTFAFLEGGVGWACNLLMDLIGHWEKRHAEAMEAHVRPTNVDLTQLTELIKRYGGPLYNAKLEALIASPSMAFPYKTLEELTAREYREQLDDFAAAEVTSAEALRHRFTDNFYFGCEADDVTTAWAFDQHGNHRLKPLFSSDVGHFDVIDMTKVLEEAYELIDDGLISEDDFREFVFTYAARLHTSMNPDFFAGTVVEDAVTQELNQLIK